MSSNPSFQKLTPAIVEKALGKCDQLAGHSAFKVRHIVHLKIWERI
jgi:hypothetical protein